MVIVNKIPILFFIFSINVLPFHHTLGFIFTCLLPIYVLQLVCHLYFISTVFYNLMQLCKTIEDSDRLSGS